jgi:hypothetical protein
MTKINPPKFSSPELQKAIDAARPALEGADDAKSRLSTDLKQLESYLREVGLSQAFRLSTGKGFSPEDTRDAEVNLDATGSASGFIEEESLLWAKDGNGRFRLLYEQCRWEGGVDVDMPGGPYYWVESTLAREVKPLIEASFEVRKRMYESHVVDFVNAIVKQVRIDRPKSASERADEFNCELSAVMPTTRSSDNGSTKPKARAKFASARNESRKSGPSIVRGVYLSSRHDSPDEIDEMGSIVDALPDAVANRLDTMFCDSKACAWYSVTLKQGAPFERTAEALHKAFIAAGGFNGLQVVADNGATREFDPWWPEDTSDPTE